MGVTGDFIMLCWNSEVSDTLVEGKGSSPNAIGLHTARLNSILETIKLNTNREQL